MLAASLVACGGGGSSQPTVSFPSQTRVGTASAGADTTVANFPVLSGDAVEALLSTIGGGEALSQPLGAGRARAAALGRWAATRSASRVAAASRPRAMAALPPETLMCSNYPSGYITLTANDADNNGVLTAGDSATISFVNCIQPAGSPAIDGSFSMVFNVLVLDAQQQPTPGDVELPSEQHRERGAHGAADDTDLDTVEIEGPQGRVVAGPPGVLVGPARGGEVSDDVAVGVE